MLGRCWSFVQCAHVARPVCDRYTNAREATCNVQLSVAFAQGQSTINEVVASGEGKTSLAASV